MKMTLLLMSIMTSSLFMNMKHPLSMGSMLMIQTTLSCMLNGMNSYSYWFSYILFITFIGGMMVLFIYMSSIASNEKFKFSIKLLLMTLMMVMLMMLMINVDPNLMIKNINSETMSFLNSKNNNKEMSSIMKMFNFPSMMISMMMILYLLFTMISVVKITNIKEGPLRMKN
uniref:NADH-ubiquinone oxidoreductase chain 6 n=1 Tax=Cosmoscarta bispecularis TaxID=798355 RepID=A0A3S8RG75_9HEMI|nr:NADH dehydrogenase subunit 6 [Cosmoscarta bispecularis]AZJ53287.1 NADH dehydrogenase subunit 6 [Cosmoscarta bispecularis]